MATRPQALLAAMQATPEAAKDKAAEDTATLDVQARAAKPVSLARAPAKAKATPAHRVPPAMRMQAGMPEPARAAPRPQALLAAMQATPEAAKDKAAEDTATLDVQARAAKPVSLARAPAKAKATPAHRVPPAMRMQAGMPRPARAAPRPQALRGNAGNTGSGKGQGGRGHGNAGRPGKGGEASKSGEGASQGKGNTGAQSAPGNANAGGNAGASTGGASAAGSAGGNAGNTGSGKGQGGRGHGNAGRPGKGGEASNPGEGASQGKGNTGAQSAPGNANAGGNAGASTGGASAAGSAGGNAGNTGSGKGQGGRGHGNAGRPGKGGEASKSGEGASQGKGNTGAQSAPGNANAGGNAVAARAAPRPQALLAAMQATPEAAKDKAAEDTATLDVQARAAKPVSLARAPAKAKATPAHRVPPAMRMQAGMPEPARAAPRPQALLAAMQATPEAAKDKAAEDTATLDVQARAAKPVSLARAPAKAKATPAHRVPPAMRMQAGMPEPARAAPRPQALLAAMQATPEAAKDKAAEDTATLDVQARAAKPVSLARAPAKAKATPAHRVPPAMRMQAGMPEPARAAPRPQALLAAMQATPEAAKDKAARRIQKEAGLAAASARVTAATML